MKMNLSEIFNVIFYIHLSNVSSIYVHNTYE
jgi:hypothetical protein